MNKTRSSRYQPKTYQELQVSTTDSSRVLSKETPLFAVFIVECGEERKKERYHQTSMNAFAPIMSRGLTVTFFYYFLILSTPSIIRKISYVLRPTHLELSSRGFPSGRDLVLWVRMLPFVISKNHRHSSHRAHHPPIHHRYFH
jgi:hypothetical protein